MTLDDLKALFKKHEDEYIDFDRVEHKLANRPDLHAFILLDRLVPGKRDIVATAEHDQFWVEVSPEDLAEVVTEEQVIELLHCGIMYDSDIDSLSFFV